MSPPHNQLICSVCGSTEAFNVPQLEALEQHVADRYGFELRAQRHELYGICRACLAQKVANTQTKTE